MLSTLFNSQNYDTKFISLIVASYLAPIDKNKLITVFPKFDIRHKICSESTQINNFLLKQPAGFKDLINTINENDATCHITGGCALKLYTGSNWVGDIDMEIITQYPTNFLVSLLRKNHHQYNDESKSDFISRVKTWYIEEYDIEYYQGLVSRQNFNLIKLFIITPDDEDDFKIDIWVHNTKTITDTFDLSCCKIRTSCLIYPSDECTNPSNYLIIDDLNKNLLDNNLCNLCEYAIYNIIYFAKKIECDNGAYFINLNSTDSHAINSLIKNLKRVDKYKSRGFKLIRKDKYLTEWCGELFTKIGLDINLDKHIIESRPYKLTSNIEKCKYI
jgi:hypothetical protein